MSFIRTLDEFALSETDVRNTDQVSFRSLVIATPSKSAFTLPSSGTLVALPGTAPDFGSQLLNRSFGRV
jgi:hypothetical protein